MTARGLFAAATLATLVALFALKIAAKMPDFEVYWQAGSRALAAEPLYREEDEHYQFKYLPAFAVLAIPAALLPLTAGKAIWFGVSVALIPILIGLSLAIQPDRRKPAWVLCGATALLMAKFYGHELVLGQANLLFAVIVLAAVYLEREQRPTVSGLLMALAVVIKPYAVLFMPWLAARRAVHAVLAAGAGLTVAFALPAAIYGVPGAVDLHVAWWRTVTQSTAPNLLNADNVSLAAMYAKWLGPGATAAALATVSALALLALTAAIFLRRGDVGAPAGLEAALLLTLIPLLSPQGWDYVFLVATPAIMYIVNYDRQLPVPLRVATWLALAVVAFTLYDVVGRRAYGRFMALSTISVCFLVVIAALAALRFRRVA